MTRYIKKSEEVLTGKYASIHCTGSITGMKKLGYWSKNDRIVRQNNYYYNLDRKL